MRTAHSAAARGLVGAEPAGEEGAAKSDATRKSPSSLANERRSEDHAGLVGEQAGERLVGAQAGGCLDHAGPRDVFEVVGPPMVTASAEKNRAPRSRRRRQGRRPSRRGRSDTAWPSRYPLLSRCRPRSSSAGPGHRCSAAPHRRSAPAGSCGRRRRDGPPWRRRARGRPQGGRRPSDAGRRPQMRHYGTICLNVNDPRDSANRGRRDPRQQLDAHEAGQLAGRRGPSDPGT